jgi:hypothetical protein
VQQALDRAEELGAMMVIPALQTIMRYCTALTGTLPPAMLPAATAG